MPNEHYGFDLNYAYSDVYTATNICYEGVATNMPGGTTRACACTRPLWNPSASLSSPR